MTLILKDFFMMAPTASRPGSTSTDKSISAKLANGKALKVVLEASHAGMRNENFSFYSPTGMRNSSHTWVYPHRRPIQIHHDDLADPIGRVIGARYVPFDHIATSDAELNNMIRLVDSAATPSDMVMAANLLGDSGVLDREDWSGVGKLVLEGIVTDSLAAEKILDERYLQVSVTQKPKSALCNICGQDWVVEPCDHSRGSFDKDSKRRMFLVVGDSRYGEVSYINNPADLRASTVEATPVEIESAPKIFDMKINSSQTFELVDSLEEDKVPEPTVEKDNAQPESAPPQPVPTESQSDSNPTANTEIPTENPSSNDETPPVKDILAEAIRILFEDQNSFNDELAEVINEAIEKEIDLEDGREESDAVLTAKKRKALKSGTFCGPNESYPVPDKSHAVNALARVKQFGSPSLQARVHACVCRKFPGLPSCNGGKDSIDSEWTDEILSELNEEIEHPITKDKIKRGDYIFQTLEDAKLSTAQRKSLPASAFCGPNRSFPVNDCAHYLAAQRLCERYQGPGDKSKIMACIEAKGRALGCMEEMEGEEDDAVKNHVSGCLDCLPTEDLLKTFSEAEKILSSRNALPVKECPSCKDLSDKISQLTTKVAELEPLADRAGSIAKMEEQLTLLRDEWKTVVKEHMFQVDAHQKTLVELEAALNQVAKLHLLLNDKAVSVEVIEGKVKAMSLDSLRDYVGKASFEDSIKLSRSGITQEPQEKISISDVAPISITQKDNTSAELKGHAETVVNIRKNSGRVSAQKYVDQLKKRGKVPVDFTLADADNLVAK